MGISASHVKELREKTGAGIMECKKALIEVNGDIQKAIEVLRKRGIAAAQKKVGRTTSEGIIEAYIHPSSRLGVLLEINCESDFVAKTENFTNLAKDIAMQIAATNPIAIKREDLNKDIIEKELEIYRAQAKEMKKPENIIEKIASGKLEKYYQEVCLLDQQFIKDSDKTVKDILMDTISKIGENITIRKFSRFRLGEDS